MIVVVVGLGALASTGCASDDEPAASTSTTASDDPTCQAFDRLAGAWSFAAAEEVLGDDAALTAASEQAQSGIDEAVDVIVADPTIPADVAADAEVVRLEGIAYLQSATAWATNEDPSAVPTLAPGTSDSQQGLDAWAVERCGREVWG